MTIETCTLAEFAKRLGVRLPYVTRLHQADRLVMASDGRVLADASLERLASEEANGIAAAPARGNAATTAHEDVPAVPSLTESRARREHFLALAAERDYRQSMRELAPSALLESILARAGTRIGAILDAVPGQLRRNNPALTQADISVVAEAITRARNIAAGLRLADLFAPDSDTANRDTTEPGAGNTAAPSHADGERHPTE